MAGYGTLRKVPKDRLAVSKPVWWLETRMHFSFADYYNPDNICFGALRVCNDDIVRGGGNFGRHTHKDAEIFTYVVQGELSHRKAGEHSWERLGRGCLQYLSAGTGVAHEEANQGKERLRYVQVWVTPAQTGRVPQYGSINIQQVDRRDCLLRILRGTGPVPKWAGCRDGSATAAKLQQDVNVFVSECNDGIKFEVRLGRGRQLYALCIEGRTKLAGTELTEGDAMEVQAPYDEDFPLAIASLQSGTHLLIIEMAREVGSP